MANKVKAKRASSKKVAQSLAKPVAKQQRRGRSSTSRISAKHQVTIPVEVLRNSNLAIGDEVEIAINEHGVVEVKKVLPFNPFQALADAMGDTYVGFDLEKERAESWD
jgi:bifunctional DNA-binding transcriptional regulator/antitoxin component of YhaV-PrlF toxin-antitoxin module